MKQFLRGEGFGSVKYCGQIYNLSSTITRNVIKVFNLIPPFLVFNLRAHVNTFPETTFCGPHVATLANKCKIYCLQKT